MAGLASQLKHKSIWNLRLTSKLDQLRLQSQSVPSTLQIQSFSDHFSDIIARIRAKRKISTIKSVEHVAYRPRYTYTGTVCKNNYHSQRKEEFELHEAEVRRGNPKKICLLLGYSGGKYNGCQRQKNSLQNTIEEHLLKALLKNEWITPYDYYNSHKIDFERASRTDKGVSAARQCISLLMNRNHSDLNIQSLNVDLPRDIRIFGIKQVTKTFNARTTAQSRTYSYTLPTVSFAHYGDQTSLQEFRISAEKMQNVYDILQLYNGTRNFHNFTIKKEYFESNSIRNMLQLDVSEPFICHDIELVTVRIHGASFMMHQIRKMIGLLLAVVRQVAQPSIYQQVFTSDIFDLPTAPGLGLVLEQVHYDKYNRSFGDRIAHLTWNEYENDINDFREKYIFPTIVKGEIENNSMLNWVETLFWHCYEMVPDDQLSCIRKGRRPPTTFYERVENECEYSNIDDREEFRLIVD